MKVSKPSSGKAKHTRNLKEDHLRKRWLQSAALFSPTSKFTNQEEEELNSWRR